MLPHHPLYIIGRESWSRQKHSDYVSSQLVCLEPVPTLEERKSVSSEPKLKLLSEYERKHSALYNDSVGRTKGITVRGWGARY